MSTKFFFRSLPSCSSSPCILSQPNTSRRLLPASLCCPSPVSPSHQPRWLVSSLQRILNVPNGSSRAAGYLLSLLLVVQFFSIAQHPLSDGSSSSSAQVWPTAFCCPAITSAFKACRRTRMPLSLLDRSPFRTSCGLGEWRRQFLLEASCF